MRVALPLRQQERQHERFQPVPAVLVLKLGLLLLLFTRLGWCEPHSEITWTISKSSSCEDEQQLGCRCETMAGGGGGTAAAASSQQSPPQSTKPRTQITCACEGGSQTVSLQGSGVDRAKGSPTEDVTWRIENCGNVTVHANVLPKLMEADFRLEFINISSLKVEENAFENCIGSTSSPPTGCSIKFSECGIEQIPARAFPSNLERIEFLNCKIGTVKSSSFKQLYMNKMIFENTTIDDIEPTAFYQDLTHWIARNSRFKRIQNNSITGGIRYMNWSNCVIEHVESNSINALIGHSVFEGTSFHSVETNGLTIKEWTSISYVNNTFHRVDFSGIDLTQRSLDSAEVALLKGNVWYKPSPNFILTGQVEAVIAVVENNTFMENCECGKTFSPMITTEGSKQWFVKELLRHSRCTISEKATECLSRNDTFLFFDELDLLCEAYACTQELQSVSEIFTPQLPDRLRILAIFIGTLTGAIVLSLLVTMCVYLLRRKGSKRSPGSELNKSFGGPQDFTNVVYKMPQPPPPSLRPRSTLFEDVEMEDKGVQTMPSELSTDVLEGLREKLSRPDSFWDAKETIDHLYGLIQVREQSTTNNALSSPPDVTMCNIGSSTHTNKPPTSHPPPPPSTTTKPCSTMPLMSNPFSSGVNPPPPARYAQIRPKPKTATLCEYRDPSDSQVHIYSELNHPHLQQRNNQPSTQQPQRSTLRVGLPILCEYNEPKDVQTHVYAELTGTFQPTPPLPPALRTTVGVGHEGDYGRSTQLRTPNSFSTIQRPLPDIPSSSISPVQ